MFFELVLLFTVMRVLFSNYMISTSPPEKWGGSLITSVILKCPKDTFPNQKKQGEIGMEKKNNTNFKFSLARRNVGEPCRSCGS